MKRLWRGLSQEAEGERVRLYAADLRNGCSLFAYVRTASGWLDLVLQSCCDQIKRPLLVPWDYTLLVHTLEVTCKYTKGTNCSI